MRDPNEISGSVDPYDLERRESRKMGGFRHPGSGNGDWYKLDSSSEDYLTDNKLIGKNSSVGSFSIRREQWKKDREHARKVGKQLRMSVLFIDREKPENHPDYALHVVCIEGPDFLDKYQDSIVLRQLLENHPELNSEAQELLRGIESP